MRGKKDFDNFLDVTIIELGNKNPITLRMKVRDLLGAMAKGENFNIANRNLPPCMLLEGYLAGGLVIDSGKFQRVDKFIKMGKRIGNKGMVNV